MTLKKMLIGMLLFPFLPMALVDVFIFKRGIEVFHSYSQEKATLISVSIDEVNVRVGKSGQFGATYVKMPKPAATYKYLWNGTWKVGGRVFLFDADDVSSMAPNYCEKSSGNLCFPALRPGNEVTVWVSKNGEGGSYLYKGWPVITEAALSWIKFYMLFSIFAAVCYGIISLAKKSSANTPPR